MIFRMVQFALLFALLLSGSLAAPSPPEGQKDTAASSSKSATGDRGEKPEKKLKEKCSVTTGSVTIAGKTISYTATAGTILLKKEDGTPRASVFYVAYTKNDTSDLSHRPITFTFNGGPGSSSVWLHVGAFGPRRVLLESDGKPVPPPYRLVNNEYSILDLTDLVFIDPVTTGYSRAAKGTDPKQFHGVQEDIQSVGEFIRLYTTRNRRWASPKLLAGESYGTTRAAGLSGYLQKRYGMYLNGIILVSSVLNFQTLRFDKGNDLPCILYLPTYTAAAWYHKKLPADLQAKGLEDVVEQARRFASGEYTLALMRGDALGDGDAARIAKKLSRYTGLSEDYIRRSNLRVQISRFTKELLRGEGRTVGRYDSRILGTDYDSAGEHYDFDPSYANVQGAFSTTFNDYVRSTLKFKTDLPYEILTGRVRPWSYDDYTNRYVNVGETLRMAMTRNPNLKVIIANGYYDLATPFFATEYTISHLGLAPKLRPNVMLRYYEAGHMMYTHEADHRKLRSDLVSFFQTVLP